MDSGHPNLSRAECVEPSPWRSNFLVYLLIAVPLHFLLVPSLFGRLPGFSGNCCSISFLHAMYHGPQYVLFSHSFLQSHLFSQFSTIVCFPSVFHNFQFSPSFHNLLFSPSFPQLPASPSFPAGRSSFRDLVAMGVEMKAYRRLRGNEVMTLSNQTQRL